jgi:3,4-dihydroxy 2-butanone 4-phosphate synthase/GTP cyclohydrolase II
VAIAAVQAGRPVVVIDDEDRDNEGHLVFAAAHATTENMAFMVRHTSGFVCVALPGADCARLGLPAMSHIDEALHQRAYRVTVDAIDGVGTGISATDRATTARALADPSSSAADFTRPGHLVPVQACDGGVLTRPGHTEAASDLARLAGLAPVGVLCEIVSRRDVTRMADRAELADFANEHGLALITVAELIGYRRQKEHRIVRCADTRMPTRHGEFRAFGFRSEPDGTEHAALAFGEMGDGKEVLVHVYSEYETGDVLGSLRSGCGEQLDAALRLVVAEGRGIVIYLRRQDAGNYQSAADILTNLGIESVTLLTDNPDTYTGLADLGITLTAHVPLRTIPNHENVRYLSTQHLRTRYDLDGPWPPLHQTGDQAVAVGTG